MLGIIFWVVVGMFVGWAVPQPEWAKAVVAKVKSWFGG